MVIIYRICHGGELVRTLQDVQEKEDLGSLDDSQKAGRPRVSRGGLLRLIHTIYRRDRALVLPMFRDCFVPNANLLHDEIRPAQQGMKNPGTGPGYLVLLGSSELAG